MAWIFLPWGILMPAVRPPWSMEPDDPMTMQVRVRDIRHLEPLREIMGDKLGPTHVTDSFDYEGRAYCRPADFAEAMGKVFTEIDYERFKPTTERFPRTAGQLHSAYNAVWGTLYRVLSSESHRRQYSRGATEADILAASGKGTVIPPHIPVRDRGKKADETQFVPRSGDLEDFIDYDDGYDRDRDEHEAGYRAPPRPELVEYDDRLSERELDDLVGRIGRAIDEHPELGPDLTEGYEPLPEAERTAVFEAFDAAQGHTDESWRAYLAAQRDRDAGTAFAPPDEVPPEIDPNAWFFREIDKKTAGVSDAERTALFQKWADEKGTPFGHPEWVLPRNPEAERRLFTEIFEPTPQADDAPEYLTKREIHRALGIKWPHQRKKFARFLAEHPEWGTYNDMLDSDLPQLKAEWKAYQKGRQA